MTDPRDAFEGHDSFERRNDGFDATTTPFEVHASADDRQFEVTVRVPTLPAVVEGEVGDAVAHGWFDTLERRMADAYDVTQAADGDVSVARDRDAGVVRVDFSFSAPPRQGVDDAAALVDYVEGTYVQGVIPGYDYRDPVAGLLSDARQRAGAAPSDEDAA